MIKLDAVLVVEGKDDEANIKRFFDVQIIITHGFGLNQKIIKSIENAIKRKDVIVLTDPDFAGERIRDRINGLFPGVKNAYIPRENATKDGDVGVENADFESIKAALDKARAMSTDIKPEFSQADMVANSLSGSAGSNQRRDKLGAVLGIGYANAKTFLARMNGFGVTREEFEKALKEISDEQ